MTAASLPLIVSSTRSVRLRRRATSSSAEDRKSTRLNSSHSQISYAVFCLKKKKHMAQLRFRQHPLRKYELGRNRVVAKTSLGSGDIYCRMYCSAPAFEGNIPCMSDASDSS